MASSSLPHRTVTGIRKESSPSHLSPHTPQLRNVSSSSFGGSPSGLRAEEDLIVVELGCRRLRVGFAGDAVPKRANAFDTEQTRRAGDFRAWEPGYDAEWRRRGADGGWGRDQQLWPQLDVRGLDLGLVADRIERALRDTFAKHLLVDSRPRKMALVLPPAMPLPLLSTVLDTVFDRFQAPVVSLLSSPVMTAFAAGTRSALVVDIGWHETVVTAVYEYREVQTWRTVRAGKMLLEETRRFLVEAIEGPSPRTAERESAPTDVVRFEECEEVATRILWCKKADKAPKPAAAEGLPTLLEQDESEEGPGGSADPAADATPTPIALSSCRPPQTIHVPFAKLAEPCENTFFQTRFEPASFDDHELPLHLVVYRALLQLPIDVRAVCMSRLIFTGGCANIPGLKGRTFDEVALLAQERGWDPIQGKGVDAYKKNPKLRRRGANNNNNNNSRPANDGPVPVAAQSPVDSMISPTTTTEDVMSSSSTTTTTMTTNPAYAPIPPDEVEEMLRREREQRPPPAQGFLRALDSLGPWCGASLATQLKTPALAVVDKELWAQQGVAGASRPGDIDVQTHQKQQRQSIGAGGLIRNAQASTWTLGVWGTV